jgi:succinate-acetate transporter protein
LAAGKVLCTIASLTQNRENTMHTGLRTTLRIIVGIIGVSALAALAFLITAQFWSAASEAQIHWYGHSTQVNGIFSQGIGEILIAWALMTFAVLIAIAAVVFAIAISVLVLVFTGVVLGATALMLGLPLIVIAGIVWLVVRQSNRTSRPQNTTAATQ